LCLALLLAAFLLTSCGGQASTPQPSSEVTIAADIVDVLLSGPMIVDIGPRSATLMAESNVDLACAVAFGPTTDYGQIAEDQDMLGGGHSDHHPVS
jgi:hypothetical protein